MPNTSTLPGVQVLHRLGEHFAAGCFEEPGPSALRRLSRGLCFLGGLVSAEIQPIANVKAKASSVHEKYVAANTVDGKISDTSRWVSATDQAGAPGCSWSGKRRRPFSAKEVRLNYLTSRAFYSPSREMPRKRRIGYAGAICHAMARGNRRAEIVLDDHDRRRFVVTLEEAGEASGRVLWAWVLMSGHCHFLLRWQRSSLASRTGDP